MNKQKKIIVISVLTVIILLLIIGIVVFVNQKKSKDNSISNVTKISELYEELSKKQKFSFTTVLDEENREIYAKNNNTAYTDTIYDGEQSKYIIRDGNSYLLKDEDKIYYTYKNNEINLNKVLEQLSEIKDSELANGEEEIDGKNYKYEEYAGVTNFMIKMTTDTDVEDAKTRFYFKGNDLIYIKTIIGESQELLKVEISNEVDDSLFEIPENYREM